MSSIGEQIKQARVSKNLSLEEISNRLRINVAYLKDIEQSKFDFLPKPYVVAFTKIYANFVGLNGDELVMPLREQFSPPTALPVPVTAAPESQWMEPPPLPPRSAVPHEMARHGAKRLPYVREMSISLGIILAIALLLYLVSRSGGNEADDVSLEPTRTASASSPAPEVSLDQMLQKAQEYAKPDTTLEPQGLTLEARINSQLWARLIVDGKDTIEATLPAGTIETWEAKESFKLRVGNVSALNLRLNGKWLESLGPGSGPANLTITREGMVIERPRVRRVAPDTTQRL
jgi:cytoskeletal protein RodZ